MLVPQADGSAAGALAAQHTVSQFGDVGSAQPDLQAQKCWLTEAERGQIRARKVMMRRLWGVIAAAIVAVSAAACQTSEVDPFVTVKAPLLALTHVRVIDGTGAPGIDDQTVIVKDGRISTSGAFGQVAIPPECFRPLRRRRASSLRKRRSPGCIWPAA